MPLEYLPKRRKRERKANAKQAPEPSHRMLLREMVKDRRLTKASLRRCVAYSESAWPEHVGD